MTQTVGNIVSLQQVRTIMEVKIKRRLQTPEACGSEFRGVLSKRCSENMPQIYRRKPMPECDFNKVALELYRNHNSA